MKSSMSAKWKSEPLIPLLYTPCALLIRMSIQREINYTLFHLSCCLYRRGENMSPALTSCKLEGAFQRLGVRHCLHMKTERSLTTNRLHGTKRQHSKSGARGPHASRHLILCTPCTDIVLITEFGPISVFNNLF
jgi:hypothetical protein